MKKTQRRGLRYGIIASNLVLLVAMGIFVVNDYSKTTASNDARSLPVASAVEESVNPLDKLSSADVAVHVARLAKLDESTSVVNRADTVNAAQAVRLADDQVIAKPQVISEGLKSKKDIQTYRAKAGDTVSSVAVKFGVTSDTIRLSNNLSGDTISAGQLLYISPINGIVYKVQSGDTPESIASKYRANLDLLIAFNDAELTGGFKVGERIVIPDGLSPIAPAYSYSLAGETNGFAYGSGAQYSSNAYDYGWCTWWAAKRRQEIGRPIPSNMGNAISWLGVARAAGLPTGSMPRAGAVVYHTNIGGWGHVAFVERVNPDGSARVSDMNYPLWGQATYRTIKPSEYGSYRFIY